MVTVLVSFHLAGGCVGGVDHNRLLLGLGLRENGKTYNGKIQNTSVHYWALLRTSLSPTVICSSSSRDHRNLNPKP